MTGLEPTLVQLVQSLLILLSALVAFILHWALVIAWLAWCLWGINWKNTWPVLAGGAWVPVVLGLIAAALVWSQMAPSDCACLGFMTLPNFWWQLGAVGLLAALTLFCGWLQEVLGWSPTEVEFEPPPTPEGHMHAQH